MRSSHTVCYFKLSFYRFFGAKVKFFFHSIGLSTSWFSPYKVYKFELIAFRFTWSVLPWFCAHQNLDIIRLIDQVFFCKRINQLLVLQWSWPRFHFSRIKREQLSWSFSREEVSSRFLALHEIIYFLLKRSFTYSMCIQRTLETKIS